MEFGSDRVHRTLKCRNADPAIVDASCRRSGEFEIMIFDLISTFLQKKNRWSRPKCGGSVKKVTRRASRPHSIDCDICVCCGPYDGTQSRRTPSVFRFADDEDHTPPLRWFSFEHLNSAIHPVIKHPLGRFKLYGGDGIPDGFVVLSEWLP
jgi:hypothetical protein